MSEIIIKWIMVEFYGLFLTLKGEMNKYFKADILKYLKHLFKGNNKKWIFMFFSIFFGMFMFSFMMDLLLVIIRFYNIIMCWFFSNLKFSLKFMTFNQFWVEFFSKILTFMEYFVALVPIASLHSKLEEKNKKLYVHMLERLIFSTIRAMWWKPSLSAKLAIPVEMLEFFLLQSLVVPSAFMVVIILLPLVDLAEMIVNHFAKWRLFFGMMKHVWDYNKIAGTAYLRHGASLFQIALMLQKQGFEAPKSTTFDKLKASLEYKEYRKKYKKAELTPEVLDDKTIDIYVVLLELFSETSYELKRLPMKEFFFIMFPYEILINLFFFSFYLYVGLCYLLAIIFFPMVILYMGTGVFSGMWQGLKRIHFLFFRDLNDLAKWKDEQWTQISKNPMNLLMKDKENMYEKKYNEEKKNFDRMRVLWKKLKKKD